jgi:hypothetical protein
MRDDDSLMGKRNGSDQKIVGANRRARRRKLGPDCSIYFFALLVKRQRRKFLKEPPQNC